MTEQTSEHSQPHPVDAAADAYVADVAAHDPITATYLGVPGHEDRLTDLSPDGFAAREKLTRDALRRVRAASPADERERVAQESFIERAEVELEQYAAAVPQSQVSVIASGLHEIRQVFDMMPCDTEEDWDHISNRLAAVPQALEGYRHTVTECADAGHVSARRQLAEVAAQVRSWTGQENGASDVFTALVADADVSEGLAADLTQNAENAREAVAGFGRFLEQEMVPRGREVDAVGRDLYALGSRFFLGATVDLEETYAWGWAELDRIEREMQQVAQRLAPGGGVDDAVAVLDADPGRTVQGKQRFREWMQGLADRTIADLADTHFDIPSPVRRIECCLAPTSDGGIYYTPPSEDFARPGRMWWSVPEGVDRFATWREVTTVYHEGVPGHHLQAGQTVSRTDQLNRWQRMLCWVSGHGEGWALYAERLMEELGYLEDPGNRLGMLDAQAFRAARVVVDIGMHLQLAIPDDNPFGFHPGETWSPELGLEFLRAHCRMEDAFLRFEINRYLGWPGQAPSYKVGERIWLAARADAKQRLGPDFDLKAFHRAALDLGSLGLDPLRAALARL